MRIFIDIWIKRVRDLLFNYISGSSFKFNKKSWCTKNDNRIACLLNYKRFHFAWIVYNLVINFYLFWLICKIDFSKVFYENIDTLYNYSHKIILESISETKLVANELCLTFKWWRMKNDFFAFFEKCDWKTCSVPWSRNCLLKKFFNQLITVIRIIREKLLFTRRMKQWYKSF